MISAGAAVLAVFVIYDIFDPAAVSWMPRCLFFSLTGLKCPGCGSQRMLHSLLHLDLASAFRFNALNFFALPYLGLLLFASCGRERYPRLFSALNSRAGIIVPLAVILAWWILRNVFGW